MTKVTSSRTSSFGGGGVEYVVNAHDTLEGIAARFDCTPTQLLKMNKLSSRLLFPGQKIRVPDNKLQQQAQNDRIASDPTSKQREDSSAETNEHVSTATDQLVASAAGVETTNTNGPSGGGGEKTVEDGSQLSKQEAATSTAATTTGTVPVDPQLDADCLQRFLKIRCKHFTDNEGVVSGVLLVTPNCVMFDPDVSHPLVIENGADRYGMVVAMDTIVSAALYKDASVLVDEYAGKRQSTVENQADDATAHSKPAESTVSASKNKDDESITNGDGGGGGCGGDMNGVQKEANGTESSTVAISQQLAPVSAPEYTDNREQREAAADTLSLSTTDMTTGDAATVDSKRVELEMELAKLTLVPDVRTMLRRHVSDSGRLPSDHDAFGPSGADLMIVHPQPRLHTYSCPSESEVDLVKDIDAADDVYRLSTEDDDKARPLTPKRASLSTLRSSLRRRANTLGGTLVQGAQAVGAGVGTLSGTLVHGAQAVGGTLTTGAKVVAKMPHNIVNMSSGLFAASIPEQTSSSLGGVMDIQESWFSADEGGDDKMAEQMRKKQQNYALLARLQQKTVEARQHWMNMFACATSKDEYPNLFAPVEDILPYPRQLYSDLCTELPYYLCIRLDEKRRQRRLVSRDSKEEYEFGNKTKSEFWFTVPRDKADTLYAFLIQWTPDLSEDDESAGASSRAEYDKRLQEEDPSKIAGFVVLDVDDDEAASIHDGYTCQPGSLPASLNLNRQWEIVTVEEVKRRLSLLDFLESEPLPLPEGSQLSGLLDEQKIRCLMEVLPARAQGYPWALVYSSEMHGFSLRTLYRNMQQWDEEISPTLLVIKDTNAHIFGAIVNCPIRVSDHFYGTGESLLYTFQPDFTYYRWTGDNSFIVKGNNDSLSFGAGRGVYGLWLDGDLYHGRSQSCQTFDNLPLAGGEDFIVAGVEAWGFSLSGI